MNRNRRLLLAAVLVGCQPAPAPVVPPPPVAPPRVDTVFVVKEVAAPLPEGVAGTVCLSTGFPLPIHIGATGDTLIGERRVPLRALRPGVVLEGVYAQGKDWFARRLPITFERRSYTRVGAEITLACEDLKEIGHHEGVPLFAPLDAASPLGSFYVPISPGRFQLYMTASPPRR